MPSVLHVLFCCVTALLFWGVIGIALSRFLAPPALMLPIAPALGWAIHNALALPLYCLIGFTPLIVSVTSLVFFLAATVTLRFSPAILSDLVRARARSLTYLLAVLLAFIPAVALFPKFDGNAVALAGPMFDHAKVAVIDEMTRLGVPPGNPFFGETEHNSTLAYYYLWHFSAAQLALIPSVSGWEADIALTAFTAFSSVMLMIGFAVWISGRSAAGVWVVPLAFAASLHPVLETIFGNRNLYTIILPPTGFAGWLFQTTWAPQHIASTSCVLLSSLLMLQLSRWPNPLTIVVLSLVTIAGYESSAWVGGVVFAVAAPIMAVVLLLNIPADARRRVVTSFAIIVLVVALLAYPLIREQFLNVVKRSVDNPITFEPYHVLAFPDFKALRRVLDIPAFWLIFLVIEFPAIYMPGVISLIGTLQPKLADQRAMIMVKLLSALLLVSLFVSGFFITSFADNNDLGWRAVLPAIFVMTISAAIGLSRWLAVPSPLAAGPSLLLLLLALPRSIQLVEEATQASRSTARQSFAATPAMWAAVRSQTDATERVANNPQFMAEMTPWPVNISWALFANRASCFAGSNLVLPYSSLTRGRLNEIDEQFKRVFNGRANVADIHDLATHFQCRTVVLTPQDGAWYNDPFKDSSDYTLAEEKPETWKIYRIK
jgi:hypothetical protein